MNVRHGALINQPCVYFCLLMAAVANPSHFNAFHLVLLMTAFHKTWQLLTCLFLLEIYHLRLPSIYTHTYFLRPRNEGSKNATNSLLHTLVFLFSSLFLLPNQDYKHFRHLQTEQHSHLTSSMSFHHLSDFYHSKINMSPILFAVDTN